MTDAREIRQDMWKAMAKSPFVMIKLMGSEDHAEPLTAQLDEDADGKFWFYLKRGNRIAGGGPAMAQFASKGHDLFACIMGRLSEERDPAVIDRHWSNQVEAWFEGGRNDPDLLMLRFDLEDAEIWEADMSLPGLFKMLTGQKIKGEEEGKHIETAL